MPHNAKSKKTLFRRPRKGKARAKPTVSSFSINDVPFSSETVVYGVKYRFQSLSNPGTFIISSDRLLDAAGFMSISATIGRTIWSKVRLRCISIVCPPYVQAASLTTATCRVNWGAIGTTLSGPPHEFSNTSTNPAKPASLICRPPKGDNYYSGEWNTTGTTSLCAVTAPAGSFFEVTVDLALQDAGDNNLAVSRATVGLTSGLIYYGTLDNLVSASGLVTPVGRALG
jgi:hypothetical protein